MSKDKSEKVRDPRRDPRPGDVVARPHGATRHVQHTNLCSVWYVVDLNGVQCEFGCLLEEWRIESKGAEVLHVAGA